MVTNKNRREGWFFSHEGLIMAFLKIAAWTHPRTISLLSRSLLPFS